MTLSISFVSDKSGPRSLESPRGSYVSSDKVSMNRADAVWAIAAMILQIILLYDSEYVMNISKHHYTHWY
ncbi:hypothetical protein CDAR_446321 [Caerostris darwini]|uniref:Uncharacterized protein n=1 Tax=Caerostris darwini TaxID=1538125 RepID=A0AAV4UVJ0_9ARAC|nr:hypothetical protein CDAR_446321 [Caerostris darwini]